METDDRKNSKTGVIKRVFLPLVLVLGLILVTLSLMKQYSVRQDIDKDSDVSVGASLPDFEVQEFGKGPITYSKIKAKVVLVNFWATWCDACVNEMPSIVQLRDSYKQRGFDVIAVNVDEEPEAVLPSAIRSLKIDFPVYVDPEGKLGDIFDLHAVPFTVILDKNRKVLFVENGERNWNSSEVRSNLEQWLGI